ncbi:MAG TPA: hypothetical protein VIM89_03635 [Mucilaginibacter sp.]
MKKIILLFILLPGFLLNVHAQSLTETKEWDNLIQSLQDEKWKDANDLSTSLLNKTPKNDPDDNIAALLRYMYIYSEAGLLNAHKFTQKEALKNVIGFTGKRIILPAHPVALKNAFNSIQMVNEKTDSLFITATNSDATQIFSFEYIILNSKWSTDDFKNNNGKFYRLTGIIKIN